MEISGRTRYVAIFGDPVSHTLSPAMHNAAFDKLGLDCRYAAFHVRPDGLAEAVRGLRAMGFVGANITVPHKERVIPMLDEVDDEASVMGAVNTVVVRDGRLSGHNTDGRGFIMSLARDAGFDPSGKTVFVCGAGGAARGIGFALANAGVSKTVYYDVDYGKAAVLVGELNKKVGRETAALSGLPTGEFVQGFDLVVNATPLGMRDNDPLPFPDGAFRPGQVVYDIVYNPARTRTFEAAEAAGARAANGLGMLLYQGVLAFSHWFGVTPPVDAMRDALAARL